jgi:hypothetical protein
MGFLRKLSLAVIAEKKDSITRIQKTEKKQLVTRQ